MVEDYLVTMLGWGDGQDLISQAGFSCSTPWADGLPCPCSAAAGTWPSQHCSRAGLSPAGTAPASPACDLFPGWKKERDSWGLFGPKCESHRGVFSSYTGLSSKSASNWFCQAQRKLLTAPLRKITSVVGSFPPHQQRQINIKNIFSHLIKLLNIPKVCSEVFQTCVNPN